jgi:hypothetical protein
MKKLRLALAAVVITPSTGKHILYHSGHAPGAEQDLVALRFATIR